MPILSELSRRFHMLTTDAKPDPPRVDIQGYTHNVPSSTTDEKAKSVPITATPDGQLGRNSGTTAEEKALPNGAIPTNADYAEKEESYEKYSPTDSREQKKPNVKTKPRSKRYKSPHGANIVNYNIVNSNGVKIGARTSYICNVNQYPAGNAPSPEGSWSKRKFRRMPVDVEALSSSTEEISLEDIFVIKTHVGHGWRDVARRLSYSDGQIDQFEENHRFKGIDEVMYQLLLDWKQANTKDAEIGALVSILWTCQEYDCAERLAATRKSPS